MLKSPPIGRYVHGERIVHVLSWHQVQNEEQLGEALKQIQEAGLIPEEQVRLCVVCDGAEWIWKHVQALFPQARQGLDYSHCAQYLHRVAKAHYGASVQAVEWVEATMTRLYLSQVGVVLGGLTRMQAQSDEAAKAMANCWDYLDSIGFFIFPVPEVPVTQGCKRRVRVTRVEADEG